MSTESQLAYSFTKSLRRIKFEEIHEKLGITKTKSGLDQRGCLREDDLAIHPQINRGCESTTHVRGDLILIVLCRRVIMVMCAPRGQTITMVYVAFFL